MGKARKDYQEGVLGTVDSQGQNVMKFKKYRTKETVRNRQARETRDME